MTKRAFQALRIAVNQEILNLKVFLEKVPDFMDYDKMLKADGMNALLMIITFHSLEESLVSSAMTQWKRKKLGTQATRKWPILPSEEEL